MSKKTSELPPSPPPPPPRMIKEGVRIVDPKEANWLFDSLQQSKKEVDRWPNWMRVASGLNPISRPKKKDVIRSLAIEMCMIGNPDADPYDCNGEEPWKEYKPQAELAYKYFKKNAWMLT